ncbi:GntR family transcriptional regulator [Paracoccus sanguinis]|uniref:GntR family transcriptional regulator n=1 Tax=Paracoccus sanguinis TaxID=1545044 RepID=UPI0009DEF274|nr:GntR family transcriptional regulator [Paracoccus sanguinis]
MNATGAPPFRAARPRPLPPGAGGLNARDRAYLDLRYRILNGRLAPGTTLLETEIAALLGLSRTPVREALIRLAEEGLVLIRPRHGVTVIDLTVSDFRDILDVFSALEVRAVALAAARPPAPADAARLTQLVQRMERATEAGDIARWSDLDDDFHSTLVGLCGNARLLRSIGEYWGQQYRGRRLILPHRPLPEDSNREHRVILQAVLAGDPEAAHAAHLAHRARADRDQLALLTQVLGPGMPARPDPHPADRPAPAEESETT